MNTLPIPSRKSTYKCFLLKKIYSFGATTSELVHLWKMYCRSVLEQSSVFWSSSISQNNKNDLEITQKSFSRLILKNQYTNYQKALLKLNQESLHDRREELSLRFTKSCLKNPKFKNLFPLNQKSYMARKHEKYLIPHCNTERLRKSSIIQMRHQLNKEIKRTVLHKMLGASQLVHGEL